MEQLLHSGMDLSNAAANVGDFLNKLDPLDLQNRSKQSSEVDVRKTSITGNKNELPNNIVIHYMLNFRDLVVITLACPLVTILTCLVTGFVFQFDDIHETHCRVFNIIPSISAITGISPQKYLWRISIAVHLGPRLLIAAAIRAYHQNSINPNAHPKVQEEARKWTDLAFWMQVIEIASLTGVTYISNRENYPAHEKIFITFMASSILHMWASIKSTILVAETGGNLENVREAIRIRKKLLGISIASLIGIIVFFLEHRFLCHNMAFSWFALCEYIFAIANITFHFTRVSDFPTEHLAVVKGFESALKPQDPKLD